MHELWLLGKIQNRAKCRPDKAHALETECFSAGVKKGLFFKAY